MKYSILREKSRTFISNVTPSSLFPSLSLSLPVSRQLPLPCDKLFDEGGDDFSRTPVDTGWPALTARTSTSSSKARSVLIVISASKLHATLVVVLPPLSTVGRARETGAFEETGVADEIAAGHVRPYFRRAARREMELFNKTIHLFLIYTLRSSLVADLPELEPISRQRLYRTNCHTRISRAYLARN